MWNHVASRRRLLGRWERFLVLFSNCFFSFPLLSPSWKAATCLQEYFWLDYFYFSWLATLLKQSNTWSPWFLTEIVISFLTSLGVMTCFSSLFLLWPYNPLPNGICSMGHKHVSPGSTKGTCSLGIGTTQVPIRDNGRLSTLVTVIDLCFLSEAKHFAVFKIQTRLSCWLFNWLLGERVIL